MSQLPPDFMLSDIDALFCAVTERLRQIADGSVEQAEAASADAADHLRASVRDCVTELDHLHSMLAHEVERRRRLEQIANDAQAALTRAPPEVASVLGSARR